jgi:hypothetical protein
LVEELGEPIRQSVARVGEIDADRLVDKGSGSSCSISATARPAPTSESSPTFRNHKGAVIAVRRRSGSAEAASSCRRS